MPNHRGTLTVTDDAATSPNWSSLLGKAIDDVSRIAQAEIRLLGVQMNASVEGAIESVLPILVASAIFVGAEACLLAAAVLLLHQWLPWWIAFAVAGIAALVIGLVLRSIPGTESQMVLVSNASPSRQPRAN